MTCGVAASISCPHCGGPVEWVKLLTLTAVAAATLTACTPHEISVLHADNPGQWDWDDPDAVHAAWRTAVRDHHPDRGGDPERFRLLTEARDLLIAEAS